MSGQAAKDELTLTREDFDRARENVAPHVYHTPLLTSRSLSEATGFDIRLKAELFQRGGAYKVRGPMNARGPNDVLESWDSQDTGMPRPIMRWQMGLRWFSGVTPRALPGPPQSMHVGRQSLSPHEPLRCEVQRVEQSTFQVGAEHADSGAAFRSGRRVSACRNPGRKYR